jgi:hypothetical protein
MTLLNPPPGATRRSASQAEPSPPAEERWGDWKSKKS